MGFPALLIYMSYPYGRLEVPNGKIQVEGRIWVKGRGGPRKERSDKKYDVDCVVHAKSYELIARLAYICDLPLKDVSEKLCVKGFESKGIIEEMSYLFRREFVYRSNFVFIGDPENKKYQKPKNANERVYFRVHKGVDEKIDELAFALDSSKRAAVGLLIETALQDNEVFESLIKAHCPKDEKRMEKLKYFLVVLCGKSISIIDNFYSK